ncbi:glutathione S-transferase [Mycena epipterygia]|nr:glutathione S-transferase [Mycena epipterygia]
MVLKLYATPYAGGGSGLVAMVLAEKKIPFEHILVDLEKGDTKTPDFLAKQPFGEVPVIDDNGFVLYESRAICRYLEEKYADQGPALIPRGVEEKAMFEQAASVEFANFHPQVMKVWKEAFGKMRSGVPVDEAALAAYISDLSKTLDVYEGILGKQKFLAGNELTLADLFHLWYAPLLALAGVDIMTTKGPNTARWWNEVISRPAWTKLQAAGIQSSMI